ncbi:MAG: hypothetical protein JST55_14840 [Bacteroidetes bacterium]|nr:hypothetical protein [Bacteroidota bacterium]
MKNILALSVIFFLSVIFSSCSDDNPVTSTVTKEIQWTQADSISPGYISCISVADENTVYYVKDYLTYKSQNGVTTFVNMGDDSFVPNKIIALSADYIVFSGYNNTNSVSKIKVLSNGTFTTINNLPEGFIFSDVYVAQQNVIYAARDSNMYKYDNGTVTTYTISSQYNTNGRTINRLLFTNGKLYAFCYGLSYTSSIYKFENNAFQFVMNDNNASQNFFLPNFWLKLTSGYSATNCVYFKEPGWVSVFTGQNRDYRSITGGGLDFLYTIARDSSNLPYRGLIWNGTNFVEDYVSPVQNGYLINYQFTETKGNVFYLIGYKAGYNILYKGKRITG